jgi:cell division protein FtsW (lipid II flippase)
MIGTLLTFFAVGLVTLLVAGIVLSIVGVVFSLTFGLATFLLFKVAPILLVGWIVVKVIEKVGRKRGTLSDADRRWLEGE